MKSDAEENGGIVLVSIQLSEAERALLLMGTGVDSVNSDILSPEDSIQAEA